MSTQVTITPDQFKAAFRNHPAGVTVVTADVGEGPVAMTATSVISVSAVPPLLAFSASELSSSTPTLRAAETLVVHFLTADQLELAKLCATSGVNRFRDGEWTRLPTGEPMYPDAAVWMRGRVVNRIDAGASTLFLVEGLSSSVPGIEAGDMDTDLASPLVYHHRSWHTLGEASKL